MKFDAVCWAAREEFQPDIFEIDPLSARILLSNNFESGSADPWYDNSPSTVQCRNWMRNDPDFFWNV
jgi:hypothetical protein